MVFAETVVKQDATRRTWSNGDLKGGPWTPWNPRKRIRREVGIAFFRVTDRRTNRHVAAWKIPGIAGTTGPLQKACGRVPFTEDSGGWFQDFFSRLMSWLHILSKCLGSWRKNVLGLWVCAFYWIFPVKFEILYWKVQAKSGPKEWSHQPWPCPNHAPIGIKEKHILI